MKKTTISIVLFIVVGAAIISKIIFFPSCGWEEQPFNDPSFQNATLSDEVSVWADKFYQDDSKSCLYATYGGQISEFIPNNEYSADQNPTAIQLKLKPIGVVLLVDKFCTSVVSCRDTYIKYIDNQGITYLSNTGTLSDWALSKVSNVKIGESPESFSETLLLMIDTFQSLDDKQTKEVTSGFSTTNDFYQCVNSPDFDLAKQSIIQRCSYEHFKSNESEDLPQSLTYQRLPYECQCSDIIHFMTYGARDWSNQI